MIELYIREFEFPVFDNPWLSEVYEEENIKAELLYFEAYTQPLFNAQLLFSFDLDLQYGNAINLPQREVILLPYEDEKYININYNIMKFHSLERICIAKPKIYTCPIKISISTESSVVLESFSLKNNEQKIIIYA